MPHIVIDGQKIETAEGKTIIEAAIENGIGIPHFCWHPSLTIAGNCRICLVDTGSQKKDKEGKPEFDENGNPVIAYFPKLQIACATKVTDGMYVDTKSEKVDNAQKAVMEFLLINHPLDCPICDEAGQCKLQEYAFRYSRGESRFDDAKNQKEKRTPWGPTVMFDGERCISCSRCIRFANEIAHQPVLSFVQRGDHVTIETFPGTQWDNPYSLNVTDICPVGALTSIDFRFKARVWDMSFNPSVCPGCARGCNMDIGVRNNEILRLDPRPNKYVNEFWMCDPGRLTQYPFVNENRIAGPMVRKSGVLTETSWEEATKNAIDLIRGFKGSEIMVIGSSRATNEDNYALLKFAQDVLKTSNIDFVRYDDPSFGDEFLRVSDRSPNTQGIKALGFTDTKGVKLENLAENISKGNIKAMYVMDEDISDISPELTAALDTVGALVVHASNHTKTTERAHVVLASSTYAELTGTFTNINKRVQLVRPAVTTQENARYMGMKMSRLDRFGAYNDRWTHGPRRNCRQSWRSLQHIAKLMGTEWNYSSSEHVFDDIAKNVGAFKGMGYEVMEAHQGLTLGQGATPDPKVTEYVSHYFKPV